MQILKIALTMFIGSLSGAAVAAGGGPMGGGSDMPQMREMSPQEMARSEYNEGVRAVKQAKKYEADAQAANRDDKKAKAAEKARKQYDKARAYFVGAVMKVPTMHEAWNYIGYTSRKLGDVDKSLTAYNEALRLKPDYLPAVEYRGVAYLMLNRVEDAKAAYMTLFRSDRELAAQLMDEMQRWVTEKKSNADAVNTAQLDAFGDWINERKTVAQQTASLSSASTSTWQ